MVKALKNQIKTSVKKNTLNHVKNYIKGMGTSNLKKALSGWFNELRQPILLEQSPEAAAPLQNGGRDETFDVLKGIAIILMIVGHCKIGPLKAFIFSFHMPLFFFIAGYFFLIRPLRKEIYLNIKRLIIPYIFIALCVCFCSLCEDVYNYTWADGSHTQEQIIAFLFGFRGHVAPDWLTGCIIAPWFILAMFWARIINNILMQRIKSIFLLCTIFITLAIIGIILNEFLFIPFCIPQGLCAAGFLFIGVLTKKYGLLDSFFCKKILPILIALWFYGWIQNGIEMIDCAFPIGYIFNLLGALGAFCTLYTFVKNSYIKESLFWKGFHFCGRYSLVIYSVHSVEQSITNWTAFAITHHIPMEHFGLVQVPIRIAIAISITLLLLKIRPIREQIFQIKAPLFE